MIQIPVIQKTWRLENHMILKHLFRKGDVSSSSWPPDKNWKTSFEL